ATARQSVAAPTSLRFWTDVPESPALPEGRGGEPAGPWWRACAQASEAWLVYVQGHHALGARPAFHQSGAEPRVRVQSRRGRPRVRGGGAAGSVVRDGALGTGPRARTQHQCRDGIGRQTEGVRAGAKGGGQGGDRDAARARLHQ